MHRADTPITTKIFEPFHCRQVGPGESIMIVDHTVQCTVNESFTAEYLSLCTLAMVLVCAWPLGVPAMLSALMWKNRSEIHTGDEDTLKLYGPVINAYTDKQWYWELVELGRKLALAGLIGLLGRGSVVQMVAAQFISLFFFAVHYRAQPFEAPMLNAVKSFSELVIFGNLLVSTVLQVHAAEFADEVVSIDDYGTAQIGLCLMMVPVTICFMVAHIRDLSATVKQDQQAVERELKFDTETTNPLRPDNDADVDRDIGNDAVFDSESKIGRGRFRPPNPPCTPPAGTGRIRRFGSFKEEVNAGQVHSQQYEARRARTGSGGRAYLDLPSGKHHQFVYSRKSPDSEVR